VNVGSRDWLEASKDMQVRSSLPPVGSGENSLSGQASSSGYSLRNCWMVYFPIKDHG
jgi:hypothetical protein